MEPGIIFEDSDILVLDKPAGWIVNDSETTKGAPTVQGWLSKNFDFSLSRSREKRSGIVHRLDKETSGALVVAKNAQVFENLQAQFKKREVEKVYTALVHGRVEPRVGEIKSTVGRLPWNRERFGVMPGGREAETRFKVLAYFGKEKEFFSYLEFYPKTGRTHQIRIHAKFLGHPVVSDYFYAGRKTQRKDRSWCPRLFLHAAKISFIHPRTGQRMTLASDLPADLKNSLNCLEKVE